MASEPGFFEKLTGSAVDESAVAQAQLEQGFRGSPLASMMFSLGQMAGQGLGVAGTGLVSRSKAQDVRDGFTAKANGISVNELRSRRAIRQELGKEEFADDGSFEARMRMAKRAASIARQHGDLAGQARALALLDSLKAQQVEFNKLKAQAQGEQTSANKEGLIDAFHNGKDVTGELMYGEDAEGNRVPGLLLGTPNGSAKFVPFGPELSRDNPALRKEGETLDQRIRKSTARQFVADLKKQIADSASSIRKFGRVMATVADLRERSLESALGGSGKTLTFIDDAVQNIKGIGQAFFGSGANVDDAKTYRESADGTRASGVRAWMSEMVGTPDADVWDAIQLPDGVVEASKEAQIYRANLMELAYLAARLAEPSNRGLSDNDIRNALQRLGDSNRPEIIMTRFAEILGDSAFDIEQKMGTLYGNFGEEYTDRDIQQAVGGDTYFNYKSELDRVQNEFGFNYGQFGEVTWRDVSENEAPTQPSVDLQSVSDEEFAEITGL